MAIRFTLTLLLWPAVALQAAATVTHIAAGDGYSLFVKSDGSLWGMGGNGLGELGDGSISNAYTPEEVVSNGVVAVAAGGGHSLFIKSDGGLWGMGYNYSGQLGDGTTNYLIDTPEEIVSNGVVAVAARGDFSLFVKSDSSLWGMGALPGIGRTSQSVEIVSNNVVAVTAGDDFSLFLKSDGSLWGMGYNWFGELGDSTNGYVTTPVEIVSNNVVAMAAAGNGGSMGDYTLFVRSDGSLWGMSANSQVQIVSNNVVAVAAGGAYSLFIKSDGSLWGMWDNSFGQLGDGTLNSPNGPEEIVSNGVVAIAAEGGGDCACGAVGGPPVTIPAHSLFIKSDGSLWAMGANDAGQLGNGFNEPSRLSPEQIVPLPQPVLARPELAATGALTTVTNVAAGDGYNFLIKSDGSLWAMGNNSSGQLGDGSFETAYAPVRIVSSNVVAAATGEDYSWGDAYPTFASRLGLFSLLVKSDGSLWAMGDNFYGQLGNGTTNDVHTPEEIVSNNVVTVAGGDDYSLFVRTDGSLWGMGDNSSGQLGDGTLNSTNRPEEIVSNGVTAVAAGGDFAQIWFAVFSEGHSLFIKSDGSLWGMGDNYYGQLGVGTGFTNKPEEIVSNGVAAVAAGYQHSLFIKSDGSLWGMGDNEYGQLGKGTTYEVNTPEEIVSNNVVAVAAGRNHSLFVKSDGSLWGMGYNGDGELGDGTTNDANTPKEIVSNNVVAVAAGYYHSLFLKSDGSVWGMGDNSYGELGNGSSRSLVPEKVAGGPWLRGTCFIGGTYRLLTSTNAALPASQWTPVWTNTIVHRGPNNFSAPLPTDLLSHDPQRFYILQSQ